MKKLSISLVVIFGAVLMSACSLSKFNKMSDIEQMNTVLKGANKAGNTIDTYNSAKKTVDTVEKVHDVVNTTTGAASGATENDKMTTPK